MLLKVNHIKIKGAIEIVKQDSENTKSYKLGINLIYFLALKDSLLEDWQN